MIQLWCKSADCMLGKGGWRIISFVEVEKNLPILSHRFGIEISSVWVSFISIGEIFETEIEACILQFGGIEPAGFALKLEGDKTLHVIVLHFPKNVGHFDFRRDWIGRVICRDMICLVYREPSTGRIGT